MMLSPSMKEIGLSFNQQSSGAFPFNTSITSDPVDMNSTTRTSCSTNSLNASGAGTSSDATNSNNDQNPLWYISQSNNGNTAARGGPIESGPSLQPSFSGFYNNQGFIYNTPTGANWMQQLKGILPPSEGFQWSASSSDTKNSVLHYSPYGTLNAGSLVLDSSRGELVNALHMTPKEILEAKALAASRSHSEAERRRRERINSHLSTLRSILPNSIKTDKASLLAEVIHQVKNLKRQVADIYQYGTLPTENDELCVEKERTSTKSRLVLRVSLCCDDRPDLMTDLKKTLDTLKLRTMKAEISTLGGRIKNVFVVTSKDENPNQDGETMIKQMEDAMRLIIERAGRGELVHGKFAKRQKLTSHEAQANS